jgi:hypothetical protein
VHPVLQLPIIAEVSGKQLCVGIDGYPLRISVPEGRHTVQSFLIHSCLYLFLLPVFSLATLSLYPRPHPLLSICSSQHLLSLLPTPPPLSTEGILVSQITDEMACELLVDTAAVLDSQRNLGTPNTLLHTTLHRNRLNFTTLYYTSVHNTIRSPVRYTTTSLLSELSSFMSPFYCILLTSVH